MSKLIAVAFPILKGKTEQWKKFNNDLTAKYKKEFTESRKKLGVQERTFFQSTAMGDLAIVTLEGENPEQAFKSFGEGTDEFTKWFLNNVKELHGIDLADKGAMPPMPELIVETEPVQELVNR